MLLPVIRQNLRAGLAQPRAVLLEACQNNLVALVHMRPAKPRHIPRASGIGPAALRRAPPEASNRPRKREEKSELSHPALTSIGGCDKEFITSAAKIKRRSFETNVIQSAACSSATGQ